MPGAISRLGGHNTNTATSAIMTPRTLIFQMVVLGLLLLNLGCAQSKPLMTDGGDSPPEAAKESYEESYEEPFDPFDDNPEDPFEEDPFDQQEEVIQTVADPIAGFNRAMFTFNDKLYYWALKPVASGYRAVVPTPVRIGVKNFFYNLLAPVRLVNCLLQGKPKAAGGELGRFAINSTVGIIGLFDPAGEYPELNPPPEDLGQTLGSYSIGNGFYIVWPLIGPSTLRDSVGFVGDWAMNPVSFMQLINLDAGELASGTTNVVSSGVRIVNDTSFRIGDYETLKGAALDPYEMFRDAYIQSRMSKVDE